MVDNNAFKPFCPKPSGRWHVYYFGGGSDSAKETADYKETLRIADEEYARYKKVNVPVENYGIKESLNYDNPNRRNLVSGVASTATQNEFSKAINQDIQSMQAQGVDPNSGKFKTATSSGAAMEGRATTDNINKTQTALQDEALQAKKNIVAIGNNQATQSLSGLNQIALASTDQANRKTATNYQEKANTAAGVGTATGIGIRALQEKYGYG